ncbi:50S ribosomal protein L10 [Mesoterricola silvestris]|uniref:Large ribosomal subunit protein uL10 n=1 Tax=Mesoterricola silvestris TaxID=2927979 RepID=A0AA48GHI5_9BACT|nr:50S ribosomal protein L10 [Mesoterricola silvestris]BDU71064.1 50S ribosomal protein L10 [Mesoterricola silvestris]
MEREQKRTEVAQLKGTFTTAKSAVVLGFKGLTVVKDTSFRKSIRESHAQYRVSKNTLLKLAVKESQFESLSEHFKGATAVATTENDVVALAKAVNNFLKDNPAANLKGAILDGKAVSMAEFKQIAELPSRDVLIGKLLYLMMYPISGIAVALEAIRKQKEDVAPAAE